MFIVFVLGFSLCWNSSWLLVSYNLRFRSLSDLISLFLVFLNLWLNLGKKSCFFIPKIVSLNELECLSFTQLKAIIEFNFTFCFLNLFLQIPNNRTNLLQSNPLQPTTNLIMSLALQSSIKHARIYFLIKSCTFLNRLPLRFLRFLWFFYRFFRRWWIRNSLLFLYLNLFNRINLVSTISLGPSQKPLGLLLTNLKTIIKHNNLKMSICFNLFLNVPIYSLDLLGSGDLMQWFGDVWEGLGLETTLEDGVVHGWVEFVGTVACVFVDFYLINVWFLGFGFLWRLRFFLFCGRLERERGSGFFFFRLRFLTLLSFKSCINRQKLIN